MFIFNITINVNQSNSCYSGDRIKNEKKEIGSLDAKRKFLWKASLGLIILKGLAYIAYLFFK